ncbi:hypothetical protein BDV39DRAFT_210029 [Aspergillus sergii]|uniref:Ankyrin repeat-containing domain protein n=1 Tax=Aspergillus sergii TaxID=1034303 RepID=A0A5N6WNC0_9EURO|nr:hypothetical protein BDV39DRAFT_210029 [Aspergillus sergii]
MAAAKAMLDEVHPDLSSSLSDHNTYALGTMGSHNIVIACLASEISSSETAYGYATSDAKDELVTWMNELPDNLDKAFEDTVEKIKRKPKRQLEVARQILYWLTSAFRYLTVEELEGYTLRKKQKDWLRDAPGIATTCLESLLTLGHSPNSEDSLKELLAGAPLVVYAAEQWRSHAREELDWKTEKNASPINAHGMIVGMVLDKEANTNKKERGRRTALSRATENGSQEIVKMLLDKKANADRANRLPEF